MLKLGKCQNAKLFFNENVKKMVKVSMWHLECLPKQNNSRNSSVNKLVQLAIRLVRGDANPTPHSLMYFSRTTEPLWHSEWSIVAKNQQTFDFQRKLNALQLNFPVAVKYFSKQLTVMAVWCNKYAKVDVFPTRIFTRNDLAHLRW